MQHKHDPDCPDVERLIPSVYGLLNHLDDLDLANDAEDLSVSVCFLCAVLRTVFGDWAGDRLNTAMAGIYEKDSHRSGDRQFKDASN